MQARNRLRSPGPCSRHTLEDLPATSFVGEAVNQIRPSSSAPVPETLVAHRYAGRLC